MTQWAKGNTNTDKQGPNLMVSRHGASANPLQKCADCQHLIRVEGYPEYCDQFVLPSGYHMPWSEGNRTCGLFSKRESEGGTL